MRKWRTDLRTVHIHPSINKWIQDIFLLSPLHLIICVHYVLLHGLALVAVITKRDASSLRKHWSTLQLNSLFLSQWADHSGWSGLKDDAVGFYCNQSVTHSPVMHMRRYLLITCCIHSLLILCPPLVRTLAHPHKLYTVLHLQENYYMWIYFLGSFLVHRFCCQGLLESRWTPHFWTWGTSAQQP